MERIIRKITANGPNSLGITIPPDVLERMRLEKGSMVEVIIVGSNDRIKVDNVSQPLKAADSSNDILGGLFNPVYCPIDLTDFSDWGFSDWTVTQPWTQANIFR